MEKFQTWYAAHETKIASTNDTHKKAEAAKKVYVPVAKKVAEPIAEATPVEEVAAPVEEETAPVEEAAPVAEASVEASVEETPAAE
jgi:hypothetical protein